MPVGQLAKIALTAARNIKENNYCTHSQYSDGNQTKTKTKLRCAAYC